VVTKLVEFGLVESIGLVLEMGFDGERAFVSGSLTHAQKVCAELFPESRLNDLKLWAQLSVASVPFEKRRALSEC